jgi:DNA helicase-2/ATP-dependent DNA helicase PcrA
MAPDTACAPAWLSPILHALDAEQRAAATLPDGPAQLVAPAGSGKTTTLIARIGVLLARGVRPDEICVVTFNRDASLDLALRIDQRLVPHRADAKAIEVRTLHALARQVLLGAGQRVNLVADRLPLIRAARRQCTPGRPVGATPLAEAAEVDTAVSAWKIEARAPAENARIVVEKYQALLEARDALDFDDLLVRAVARLEQDTALRLRWQARFSHLLVDEFQDVDAIQLRLVELLAEPERNLFVVGDDDQTIYAWRLADVRRMLDFGRRYPDVRRVILATNYRCSAEVVSAARRLIEHNRERFAKPIRAATGTTDERAPPDDAIGALAAGCARWEHAVVAEAVGSAVHGRVAFLARTQAELVPIAVALVRAGVPHAGRVATPLDAAPSVALLDDLRRVPAADPPFPALLRARIARGWRRQDELLSDEEQAAVDALLSWAPTYPTTSAYLDAADRARGRLERLRDPAAPIELLTVHAAKGREWPTLILLGMERDRFPNRRALVGSADPARALEEERRLAYVAFTRARQQLVLVLDPSRPSPFLEEAGLTVRD